MLKDLKSLTFVEMEAFTVLMKQSSPMQMEVHECLITQDVFSPTSQQLGPELAVSLHGKDGRNILTWLSQLPEFSEYFTQQQKQQISSPTSSYSVAVSPQGSKLLSTSPTECTLCTVQLRDASHLVKHKETASHRRKYLYRYYQRNKKYMLTSPHILGLELTLVQANTGVEMSIEQGVLEVVCRPGEVTQFEIQLKNTIDDNGSEEDLSGIVLETIEIPNEEGVIKLTDEHNVTGEDYIKARIKPGKKYRVTVTCSSPMVGQYKVPVIVAFYHEQKSVREGDAYRLSHMALDLFLKVQTEEICPLKKSTATLCYDTVREKLPAKFEMEDSSGVKKSVSEAGRKWEGDTIEELMGQCEIIADTPTSMVVDKASTPCSLMVGRSKGSTASDTSNSMVRGKVLDTPKTTAPSISIVGDNDTTSRRPVLGHSVLSTVTSIDMLVDGDSTTSGIGQGFGDVTSGATSLVGDRDRTSSCLVFGHNNACPKLTGSNSIPVGPPLTGANASKVQHKRDSSGSKIKAVKKRIRDECPICSFKQERSGDKGPVFHDHFSSKYERFIIGADTHQARYMCPSCKNPHRAYPDRNRLKLVVSDSTLHRFFEWQSFYGDKLHVDYVTISGGTIKEIALI